MIRRLSFFGRLSTAAFIALITFYLLIYTFDAWYVEETSIKYMRVNPISVYIFGLILIISCYNIYIYKLGVVYLRVSFFILALFLFIMSTFNIKYSVLDGSIKEKFILGLYKSDVLNEINSSNYCYVRRGIYLEIIEVSGSQKFRYFGGVWPVHISDLSPNRGFDGVIRECVVAVTRM